MATMFNVHQKQQQRESKTQNNWKEEENVLHRRYDFVYLNNKIV